MHLASPVFSAQKHVTVFCGRITLTVVLLDRFLESCQSSIIVIAVTPSE